jgi:DNA-binding GntR family transcriptional regulator
MTILDPGRRPDAALARDFSATLRDRIARALRARILSGAIEADTSLDLDDLANEFGSSRTPVREALIQLSHDGLVEIEPRRSVRVVGITGESLLDNFLVFGALSGVATQWAADRATDALVADLRQVDHVFRADTTDVTELAQGNWTFHSMIHRACGSSRLVALIAQTSRTIPSEYRNLPTHHATESAKEHVAILRAIENHDGLEARALVEHHLQQAAELMVSVLEKRGGSLR